MLQLCSRLLPSPCLASILEFSAKSHRNFLWLPHHDSSSLVSPITCQYIYHLSRLDLQIWLLLKTQSIILFFFPEYLQLYLLSALLSHFLHIFTLSNEFYIVPLFIPPKVFDKGLDRQWAQTMYYAAHNKINRLITEWRIPTFDRIKLSHYVSWRLLEAAELTFKNLPNWGRGDNLAIFIKH